MDRVEINEAEKLVRIIRDDSNPQASYAALEVRDKWLLENDLGLLEMTTDVRTVLEAALDSRE